MQGYYYTLSNEEKTCEGINFFCIVFCLRLVIPNHNIVIEGKL